MKSPKGRFTFDTFLVSTPAPEGEDTFKLTLGNPRFCVAIPHADWADIGTAIHNAIKAKVEAEQAAIITDLRSIFEACQHDPQAAGQAIKDNIARRKAELPPEEAPDSEVPGLDDFKLELARGVANAVADDPAAVDAINTDMLKKTLVLVSRDLGSANAQIDKLKDYSESLEEQLAEAQLRTDEQAKALVNKGMRIDALIRENEAKENQHREQYGTLKRAHETQAQTIRDQRAHAAKLEETCREYEKNILDLNKRLEYAEKQINDRGEQVNRQSYEIDNKYRELAERTRQVAVLTHARFDISEKMKQMVKDLGVPAEACFHQWVGLVADIEHFTKLLALPFAELAKTFPPRPDMLEEYDRRQDKTPHDPMDDLI